MRVSEQRVVKLARAIFVALAISAGFACTAAAAPSDLDASFGTGGQVATAFDNYASAFAIAIQPDGKIVAAGSGYSGGNEDFALARYNTDGSLDTSFDGDGKVTTAIGSGVDTANAVAIQPDGKIVVAGNSTNGTTFEFALARYNTDGSLDAGFSGNGMLTTAIGSGNDDATAIAIQSDGKIVVAGSGDFGGNVFVLARYDADGSLDASFNGSGIRTTFLGPTNDTGTALAIQPNGKIVEAGYSSDGSNFNFALARYNADGSLDTDFSDDGMLTTAIGSSDDFAKAVALQLDGRIVVAGYSHNDTSYNDFALARYNTDGSLDTGFDGDGKLTNGIGSSDDSVNAIAIQPNGKIVAAGRSYNGTYWSFALARYNTDGTLDTGFDGDGKLSSAIGSGDASANAVAIQPDGKIMVAGRSISGAIPVFALVRYIGDPPPPATAPTPPAAVAPATPTAKIAKPARGKTKSKNLKAFSGTAGPVGNVAKVEIALRRVDRRQLKRGRCLWLKNAKAKFVKTKAKSKKCLKQRFLVAKGTDKWSFKLRKRLPKARYELYVSVTLTTGERHTTFTKAQGNLRTFTVT